MVAGEPGALAKALQTGDQLLELLAQPLTDPLIEQVDALINLRAGQVDGGAATFDQSVDRPEVLRMLSEQQVRLEEAMAFAMAALLATSASTQAARESMRGVNRLLQTARPALLDERR